MVSSVHVTGDIGFKPTKGLKWKGKQAMTQREIQVESVLCRIQTRSKADDIQTRSQAKGKSPTHKENFLVVWLCGVTTKLKLLTVFVLLFVWLFNQT